MVKAGLIVLAAASMALAHPRVHRRMASEVRLRIATADFRSGDRDGGRVQDFWTLDVAVLHRIDRKEQGPTAWMRRFMAWFEPPAPMPLWAIID